jgi:glycerophosphoryl diester phosphodiesterase
MLVISHRGYRKQHPGNTLGAFQAAIDMGVDGIEADVRVTKDNKLILFHDRYIGEIRIRDLTYDELVGLTKRPILFAEQALDQFDGILWNLEIKSLAAVDETRKLVERYHSRRRLMVTSYWHNIAELFAAAFDIECGVLVSHRPFDMIDVGWFQGRRITVIVWDYEFVDDLTLEQSRAAGITNLAYKLHTREEHVEAQSRPFDGIITDHPEYVRSRTGGGDCQPIA